MYMIEEFLFFKQYKFHKQKLVFHRASMKAYEAYLANAQIKVNYISATEIISDIRLLILDLTKRNTKKIKAFHPCDDWLEKRIRKSCLKSGIVLEFLENPLFINSTEELSSYYDKKKKYFQADFYVHQRKSRKILVDSDDNPLHGKWSFDDQNRLKYPKTKTPPRVTKNYESKYLTEAISYVEKNFTSNYGEIDAEYRYPISHKEAEAALKEFLEERFSEFGIYEDAIVKTETHLNHSVLSALINTGLLLADEVMHKTMEYASLKNIPFNSLEGFIRQILGWREFIRLVYINEGAKQRTTNYWNFTRKIPETFYTGSTGIEPIDATINKLKKSAYNHHIERLMVLSNFMLLCEFDPDEVYRWFMEMYIDAYDWVMVPNVYGMGQFADGGLMSTKPYISSSNYILKMSDYKKGEPWTEIWDALFWRFMHTHRSFFIHNPRLSMLIKTFDKWDAAKQKNILKKADDFLCQLNTK